MPKPDDPSLPPFIIRFADGRRFFVTDESTADLLLNRVFLRFYALACLGWAMVGQPLPFMAGAGSAEVFVLWGAVAAGGLVWFYAALAIARAAHRFAGLRSIYTPLLTLPAVAIGPFIITALAAGIGLPVAAPQSEWIAALAKTAVLLIILDLFFANYVARFHSGLQEVGAPPVPSLPAVAQPRSAPLFPAPNLDVVLQQDDPINLAPLAPALPDLQETAATPSTPTDRESGGGEVMIGTESFAIADLVMLRSDDHYINVLTRHRRSLIRGRLSDVLAQIPASCGIQLNRSAWVSFAAIRSVEGEDTRQTLVVTLVTGDEERVAQSRRHALLAAMSLRQGNAA